jgi:hypothetical protein
MPDKSSTERAAAALGGGLAVLTASLGAIGGLTGGIARMFRNSATVSILLALGLVLGAVLLAILSGLLGRTVAIFLLALSTGLFGGGVYEAMNLMVSSSRIQDRPTLSAQLVNGQATGWILKIQASSSGLQAQDQLLVLVYAQPKNPHPSSPQRTSIPARRTPTPTRAPDPTPAAAAPTRAATPSAGASPGTRPTTRPSPSPSRVAAPHLDGDRLFFAQIGANIDGVASQTIEVPIDAGRGYTTIIVTAVVAEFPRDCEGFTVNIRDNTELMVPPVVLDENHRPLQPNGTLSCLTLAAPRAADSS